MTIPKTIILEIIDKYTETVYITPSATRKYIPGDKISDLKKEICDIIEMYGSSIKQQKR